MPKARLLILRRAGINTQDEEGHTPLMIAVMTPGNECLTKLLLVAGACVYMTNTIGETALMIALSNAENQKNVSCLIDAGAKTDPITRYGYAACDYALKHACYDGLFPDNCERRAVLSVLGNAGHEVCREQIGDANLLRLALLQKVFSEDIARVEQLLKMGAPANCQTTYGWSALMHAACRANLEFVQLLIRFGAEP